MQILLYHVRENAYGVSTCIRLPDTARKYHRERFTPDDFIRLLALPWR